MSCLPKSRKLHYRAVPLKISRASKQYVYDEYGNEYLDCVNHVSHVGHCHPHISVAGQEQMSKLVAAPGFVNDAVSTYARRISKTLPDKFSVCYYTNSGSEANDLALRLARSYTKHDHVLAFDQAYHGSVGDTTDVSSSLDKEGINRRKHHIHQLPCPDMYKGKYRSSSEEEMAEFYIADVRRQIMEITRNGDKLSALICEPLMSFAGVLVPPKLYMAKLFQLVHEAGGLCIADEVQVGLGRTGENYWSFQSQAAMPDIVTCGKTLGNGYPLAVVMTTPNISDSLPEYYNTLAGNPVACKIGIAVLDVIANEQLLSSAKCVGNVLKEGFIQMMDRHPMLGDVRGMGLMIGVELVVDKESRKPATETAELLSYRLKQEKILIANGGPAKNIMQIMPPMCFTCENARRVIAAFDISLSDIESGKGRGESAGKRGSSIPLDVLLPPSLITGSQTLDTQESATKRPRYEDLD